MAVIECKELWKRFGKIEALKGVTLSVESGEIYGLLGRNGAGKTTLVKILLGVTHATKGEALLFGQPARQTWSRQRVGFLPEDHRLIDYHTASSALDFYGALSGCPRAERRKRIPELLELVELAKWSNTKLRKFSKGMKQRLALAQAMLHDPDVLFFDEPTDGVDPLGRKKIRDIILRLRERGKTIFLNSHLLSEVEMVCTRIGILESGKLIREGPLEDFTKSKNMYRFTLAGEFQSVADKIRETVDSLKLYNDGFEVLVKTPEQIDSIIDILRSAGISIRAIDEKRYSLEEAFVKIVDVSVPSQTG